MRILSVERLTGLPRHKIRYVMKVGGISPERVEMSDKKHEFNFSAADVDKLKRIDQLMNVEGHNLRLAIYIADTEKEGG